MKKESIIEVKDPHLVNHAKTVSDISVLISKELGLTPNSISDIEDAALLHDIGKISIPDNILHKPGRLTDEEYTIMKSQTVNGAHIMAKSPDFVEISQIILHHHERFDGTGYPDKISKRDISIGSRIITIADSIDAMTSDRCYRKAMSLEECRAEIERNLGTMYDPAIGRIALEHWAEITEIIKSKHRN